MKRITILLAAALIVAFSSCTNPQPKLQNQQDTLSWALGRSIAEGLIQENTSFNKEIIIAAVKATLDGEEQPYDDTIYMAARQFARNQMMMEQQMAVREQSNQIAAAEQEAFANFEEKHPNAKLHEIGFYYEVVKPGKGKNAKEGDLIKFDYKGYNLITNELVDQTYGQRDPIQHVVGNPMFPALICAVQLMNEGSIYRFYFPGRLYPGSSKIPSGTPAIYEVELHKIIR